MPRDQGCNVCGSGAGAPQEIPTDDSHVSQSPVRDDCLSAAAIARCTSAGR